MKVACGYTIPITQYGLPPSLADNLKAMEEVRQAGFDSLEMEIVGGEQEYIDGWDKIVKKSQELNLKTPSIMAVTYDMFSLDPGKQKKSIEHFEQICDMSKKIGASIVTNCFYLPPELIPDEKTELYKGGPPVNIKTPDNFSWPALRDIVIEQLKKMAALAAIRDMEFAMELRAGDFVSSVDGVIAMLDQVGAKNAGVIFDCAHIHAVKEYLELAILKFGKYIKLVHFSDNDGTQAYHLVPGQGTINFSALLKRLKEICYKGYVVVDIMAVPNILDEAVKMKKMLETYIR